MRQRILFGLLVVVAALALVFWTQRAYEAHRAAVLAEGDRAGAAREKAIGEERVARVQKAWDEDRARAQAQAIEDARLAAAETLRRLNKQQENERAQQALLARMERDRDDARAAADGLRLRASAYVDAAGCGALSGDSAVACIRKAADAVGVALGQCGQIARRVAAEADDARARGLLCEADYDALTLKPAPP